MHILLVEDDKMHLAYLRDQITATFGSSARVDVAQDGREAETLARAEQIPAVVMDLRMKDRSGIDAARVIWGERPDTRVLFWSNYSDEAYLRGISRIVPDAAAYGYVLKTASSERLALALRAVLFEGQVMIDREVHSLQSSQIRSPDALTEVEHAILLDVAIGLPDKAIAERRGLSLRTVQNRLTTLYQKLGEDPDSDCGIGLNKRMRTVTNALIRKLINSEILEEADRDLQLWMSRQRAK